MTISKICSTNNGLQNASACISCNSYSNFATKTMIILILQIKLRFREIIYEPNYRIYM